MSPQSPWQPSRDFHGYGETRPIPNGPTARASPSTS
jgi:hypothetical protein